MEHNLIQDRITQTIHDKDPLAPSLLFWRALTHWLGGLGIVLLFVAVLPSLGVGGKRLFRIEAPGPEPEGVRPHIRDTARTLWYIYLGLTAVEILALLSIGRMSVYNACCHTFATLATGGFSTHTASVGHYTNWLAVDVIIIVFMLLAGVNFGLYYQLIRRKWKAFFGDTELRVYLVLMLVGAGLPHGLNHGVFLFGMVDLELTVTHADDFVLEPRIGDLGRLLYALIDHDQRDGGPHYDRIRIAVEACRRHVDLSDDEPGSESR